MSEKKTKRKRKSAAASIMERKTAAAGAAEGNHSDAAEALVVENADESNGTPAEPVVEEAEPSKVADTSAAIEDDQAPGPVAEAEAVEPQAEGAKVIAETDTPASETDGEQGASAEGATEPEVEAEPDPEPVPEVLLPVDAPPQPGPGNPSPDATTLAFLQPDAAGETRLWLYDLDGSGGSSIGLPFTPVIDENGPQWSPDGKWLALVGRIGGATATSIWLTPVDGGDCVLLGGHGGSDRQPCWSPDGSMIAFTSRQDDRDTICISPPNSDGPIVQMSYGYPGQDDRDPCWSDDSTRLVFARRTVEDDVEGDHIHSVFLGTGEITKATKKLSHRHSLRWNPGKTQVAFVNDEGEWHNIGVVNPDNSASWNLASEAGDKGDPQFSSDGKRLLYTRGSKSEVRLCERAASGANPDTIDPGKGVVSSPRWLPDNKVVYRFSPSTAAPQFIVQEAKVDAERTILPSPVSWRAGRPLIAPVFMEIETTVDLTVGGLLYRDPVWKVPVPGIVLIRDDPFKRNDMVFQPEAQALAAAGFAVFVPIFPGSPGLGKKYSNSLADLSSETEMTIIADTVGAIAALDNVDQSRMAVVGQGYGGALALVYAGARPGGAGAVIAIDPITDWDDEFSGAPEAWRSWHAKQFGLPASSRGRHALRTPATFAGVIESPLLLLHTDRASKVRSAEIEMLAGAMRELGTDFTLEAIESKSEWEIAELAVEFAREVFGENDMSTEGTMRTDDI